MYPDHPEKKVILISDTGAAGSGHLPPVALPGQGN